MRTHTALFLQFAYAVLRRTWRVEVFLFASDLARVTETWRDRPWSASLEQLPDCGAGTQIGACLTRFLHDYGHSLTDAKTFTMILSDGLDAGEPALIEQALQSVRQQCRAIIWLNPLAHLDGYAPVARGMGAALPYIDLFAPAHDLASLSDMVQKLPSLSKIPRRAVSLN